MPWTLPAGRPLVAMCPAIRAGWSRGPGTSTRGVQQDHFRRKRESARGGALRPRPGAPSRAPALGPRPGARPRRPPPPRPVRPLKTAAIILPGHERTSYHTEDTEAQRSFIGCSSVSLFLCVIPFRRGSFGIEIRNWMSHTESTELTENCGGSLSTPLTPCEAFRRRIRVQNDPRKTGMSQAVPKCSPLRRIWYTEGTDVL
jgi:hypothetical protein